MRSRLTPFRLGVLAGVLAATLTALISLVILDDNDQAVDVVLDVPGEYQEPGIATNAPVTGTPLAHAQIYDLNDDPIDTAQVFTTDARPLLINFWFSNCQPCKREMPALQEAHSVFGDRVRFIGINPQDSPEITRSFAAELGIDYEIFRDPQGSFVVANGVATFPTTLFVGADGRIRIQRAGELSSDELRSSLRQLLNES